MNKLLVPLTWLTFGIAMSLFQPLHAAEPDKPEAQAKQRLVLMPLRVSESDRRLLGAMEAALVKGLQGQYEVFSGERVAQKAREIFNKESTEHKKECDETRCMQDIAMAFQAELIAVANVTKQQDGYFLAISIQNIFDNKMVASESTPCRDCDAYMVVDKLKELVGGPATQIASSVQLPKKKAPEKEVFPDIEDFSSRPASIFIGAGGNSYSSPSKTGNIKSSYTSPSIAYAYTTENNFTVKLFAESATSGAKWNAKDFGYSADRKFTRQQGGLNFIKKIKNVPFYAEAGFAVVKTTLDYGQIVLNGVPTPALDTTLLNEFSTGIRYSNAVQTIDYPANEFDLAADMLFDRAKNTDYLGGIYNSKLGIGYSVDAVYRHFFGRRFGFSLDAGYKSRKITYATYSANETDAGLALLLILKF